MKHATSPAGAELTSSTSGAVLGRPPTGTPVNGAAVVQLGASALIFPGMINLHNHPTYNTVRLWPAPRVIVADRGLREGMLLRMIRADRGRGRG